MLRQKIFFIIMMVLTFVGPRAYAAGNNVSCECEASSCAACEIETGTNFYSAKCGVNDSKVKSCKKPKCAPVENQKACLALFQASPKTSQALSSDTAGAVLRQVANLAPDAGQITEIRGDVKVTHTNGVTEKPRNRESAFVGDLVETGIDGRIKISLRDSSELTLAPSSRLQIEKVDVDASEGKRKIALQILAGKVRSRVHKEYKEGNYYQVHTPTAVAGVRGTDFITSFVPGKDGWVSEVRTIEGRVHLESEKPSSDPLVVSSVDIPAGTYATFITEPLPENPTRAELDQAALNGHISPLFKIKEHELRVLRDTQDFVASTGLKQLPKRSIASDDGDSICSAPKAQYNECSWALEKSSGDCIRRICKANGKWEEPTPVSGIDAKRCTAGKTIVHACEGYW